MRRICQVVLPLDLRIKISGRDPVRKLVEIYEGLDYRKLYAEYLRSWRKINTAVLFEIMVLAFKENAQREKWLAKMVYPKIRYDSPTLIFKSK